MPDKGKVTKKFAERGVRRAELHDLITTLDSVGPRNSKIIEVAGEQGAGKTRLLADLTREAELRGFTVLSGRWTELEQDVPLHAFNQVFSSRLADSVLADLPAPTATLLREVSVDPTSVLDRPKRQRVPLHQAVRVLLGHCAREELMLVFDDFHWADQYSTELIEYLVRWPVDAALALVIAHRPWQASPQLRSTLAHGVELGTVQSVRLGALSVGQAAEILGQEGPDDRLEQLHRDSGGNPLYLLMLAQRSEEPEARWPTHSWDDFTEQSALVIGEFATLAPTESAVASAAAVLGDTFDEDMLAEVTEMNREEISAAVGGLSRRGLVRSNGAAEGYSFRHPVLRELLYSTALVAVPDGLRAQIENLLAR
ncbi:AAA family ATPase, partial [Actinosynnema sp. NPDC023658]|uniref:AAA family ATPase n=1 Tax=Actinosynnema sp. NPDC023658 TaxID=3155465 RepID=UPI00340D1ED9